MVNAFLPEQSAGMSTRCHTAGTPGPYLRGNALAGVAEREAHRDRLLEIDLAVLVAKGVLDKVVEAFGAKVEEALRVGLLLLFGPAIPNVER